METKATFYNNFGEEVCHCYVDASDPYLAFDRAEENFLFNRKPDRAYYIARCIIEVDMCDRTATFFRCYDQYARITHYGVNCVMKELGKSRNGKDN